MSEWVIEGTDLFIQNWDTNEELSANQVNERLNQYDVLLAGRDALVQYVRALKELVDKQAEDDGLWFIAMTAPEDYLQTALRLLHARVEEYQALSQELCDAISEGDLTTPTK